MRSKPEIPATTRRAPAENDLQTNADARLEHATPAMPSITIRAALEGGGHPLEPAARDFMEPRFGADLGGVRIHTSVAARRSARELNAAAYTLGSDIVFGHAFDFATSTDRALLAHELAHVLQSSANTRPVLRRQCLTGAPCTGAICGDPARYDSATSALEAPSRAARGQQAQADPGAVTALGHGRRATHLESLAAANGIDLSSVHGLFVDLDMASGALAQLCRGFVGWVPHYSGPSGAECVFVSDQDERGAQAYLALAPGARPPYAHWLMTVLNSIRHEVQHLSYDRATLAAVPGAVCTRSSVLFTASGQTYDVNFYLSELSAILAEFPLAFDYVRRHAHAGDYSQLLHDLQREWRDNVFNCDESVRGVLTALRCHCPCADVDAYVRDTFNFTAPGWSSAARDVFLDLMHSMFPTVRWPQ